MTEAATASLDYGFTTAGLEHIIALAVPENGASRRVMEKLGMRYDYTGEFYGRPLVHYTITKSAWAAARRAKKKATKNKSA